MRALSITAMALVFLAAACFAGAARAGDTAAPQCAAARDGTTLDRAATIASLEQLPESCLKALTIECNGISQEQLLDPNNAALCSMGYEALLRKGFGGNFNAMLAWWQRERQARPAH